MSYVLFPATIFTLVQICSYLDYCFFLSFTTSFTGLSDSPYIEHSQYHPITLLN